MRSIPVGVMAAATAALLAVSLTSCSGGGSSSSGSGSTARIMVFGSFSQPPFPLPQIKQAAQAAVDRVNKEGGVDGTTLELVSCDDQGSANGAAACGRQAVDQKVIAVVGTFTLFGDSMMQFLDKAKIPSIFPTATSKLEATSALSFPVVGAIPPSVAALLSFQKQGCTTTVLTASANAQSQQSYDVFFKPVADRAGIKTAFIAYPPDTTDFSSIAARTADAGDCVVYAGGGPDSAALVKALSQSGRVPKAQAVLSSITVSDAVLKNLGPTSNGLQLFSPSKLPSSGDPAVTKAAKDISAAGATVVDSSALNAYAAVLAIKDVGQHLKTLSAASLTTALDDSSTTVRTGIYPPIDFSKDAGFYPLTPRVAGAFFYGYVSKDGEWQPNAAANVDLAKAGLR